MFKKINTEINFFSSLWSEIRKGKFSNTKLNTRLAKISYSEVRELYSSRKTAGKTEEKEILEAIDKNIKVITYWDDSYPKLLKNIVDPPLILFVKGSLNNNQNISVVGSRKASNYGRKYAYNFSKIIAKKNINVVSGMAAGIDAQAHKAAIENSANAGLAVLGCGLNHIYPKFNTTLYQELLSRNGALVSEFGLYEKPRDYYFPRRNRIISGLSEATIVIEAGIRSGSLISARFANEQGRDVLALPGPIDGTGSTGTNKLISDGAKIICSEQDLIEYLEQNEIGDCIEQIEVTVESNELLDKLRQADYTVQSLSRELDIPVKNVYAEVVRLELKGLVRIGMSGGIEVC